MALITAISKAISFKLLVNNTSTN